MMKKKFNEEDYEYVDARTVMKAAEGDRGALLQVYERFVGLMVDYLVEYARINHLKPELLPMGALINEVWCGYQKDLMGFFPR